MDTPRMLRARQPRQPSGRPRPCVLTYQGVTHTVQEWARLTGMHPQTVHHRYFIAGWTAGETLERPVGGTGRRRPDLSDSSIARGIAHYLTMHPDEARRLAQKYGWKEED